MNALVKTLDQTVTELLASLDAHPMARRLLSGDVNTQEYGSFLEQTYLYVRQTRPFLRRAGERLAEQRRAPTLSRLFLQKADEEEGHELWVLADLEAIGRPMDRYSPPRPCPAVAAYLAWNQFQVEAGWPLGFLGTAYVLEALSDACAGTTATNLIAKNRIAGIRNGVRFLQGHADADEGHIDMLRRLLSSVSSMSDKEAIALSADVTSSLYLGLFSAMDRDEQSRHAA